MVRKSRSSFALAALGFLAASCASNGSIESGQKFGVHVGMRLEDAGAILRRQGLRPELPITNQQITACGERPRQPGEQLSAFSGRLTPFVCLFVVSGRVVAVAWEYTLP